MSATMTPIREPATAALAPLNTQALMQAALAQGPEGVAALERLVALHERMEAKSAREAYFDALRAFQAECPSIFKNKQVGGASHGGGSMQYRYADLDQIVSTVRPLLDRHGLSFSFDCAVTEGAMTATCVVRHRMGHSESSSFSCPAASGNTRVSAQQQAGGSYTFARRYALIGALGLATTDEDTDGADEPPAEPAATITAEDELALEARITDVGADLGAFLRFFKVAKVGDLPADRLAEARRMLDAKGRRAKP